MLCPGKCTNMQHVHQPCVSCFVQKSCLGVSVLLVLVPLEDACWLRQRAAPSSTVCSPGERHRHAHPRRQERKSKNLAAAVAQD